MKEAPWIFAHYIKKSTTFTKYLFNWVELITSWVDHFHRFSWQLDINCRFFGNEQKSKVPLSYEKWILKTYAKFCQKLLLFFCYCSLHQAKVKLKVRVALMYKSKSSMFFCLPFLTVFYPYRNTLLSGFFWMFKE